MGKFFGVPLYEAIYGYQVTCLVGFSTTEKLIKATDLLEFRKKVLEKIEIKTGLSIQQIEFNNEYFLFKEFGRFYTSSCGCFSTIKKSHN